MRTMQHYRPTGLCAIFKKQKVLSFNRHPERANKREPKDLARAKQARARCVCAKLLCKCYFACIELQRFFLDPATASPCGLLVCFAAPRKTSLPSLRERADTPLTVVATTGYALRSG